MPDGKYWGPQLYVYRLLIILPIKRHRNIKKIKKERNSGYITCVLINY